MTYRVGMIFDDGFVMTADSPIKTGVGNVGKFKKLHTWQKFGKSLFVQLMAGNPTVTQMVVNLLGWKKSRVSPHTKICLPPSLCSGPPASWAGHPRGEENRW
jgi:predicted proteasome-type protease